jgi:hypothetical protein
MDFNPVFYRVTLRASVVMAAVTQLYAARNRPVGVFIVHCHLFGTANERETSNMRHYKIFGAPVWGAVLCVTVLAGCAGTAPKPTYNKEIAVQYRIDADDHVQVKVASVAAARMEEVDRDRLGQLITSRLEERRARNAANSDAHEATATVLITRYERGSAFARAMLAGLGQIHIDGTVTVTATQGGNRIAEFTIAKTFAWGGIYGGSTRMEDIEPVFADGVAAALTGQQDSKAAAGGR